MEIIVDFFKKIPNCLLENNEIIMTIATMIIGIVAGWFPTLSRWRQIALTITTAVLFNVVVGFCYRSWGITFIAVVLSVIWFILSVFAFHKDEVGRWKIGRLIIDFTETADTDKPICIFGGDLNFFGNYITPKPCKSKLWYLFNRNKFIETNNQYTQVKDKGFREIRILAIKPYSNTDNDIETRRRIGYITEELKERVQIKFFDTQLCDGCKEHDLCVTCDCNNCSLKNKCKNRKNKCSKLEKLLANHCYNPDITLRGRIVTRKDNQSPCVAIATTKKPGKKYILREYSAIEKECKLYTVIWEVWWSKCKSDSDFIKLCKKEYREYKKNN